MDCWLHQALYCLPWNLWTHSKNMVVLRGFIIGSQYLVPQLTLGKQHISQGIMLFSQFFH